MRKRIDLSEFHFDWGDEDTVPTPPLEVRHVSTFKSDLTGTISSICPASDRTTWVAGNSENNIILYQSDGREIKRVATDFYVDDLKRTKMGNLLITPSLGTSVKFLDCYSCDIIDFAQVAPYKARGLHITEDQKVLVSLRNDNTAKVVVLSRTGEKIRELKYNRSGSNLFSDPDRLTRNTLDDVIVLDWKMRQVISVDRQGRYKYVYDGKPKGHECNKDFVPSDIVCDKYDNVLISDYENNSVHMLDHNGKFLRHLITEDNGLTCPCALALDDTGQLWVGQLNGQIHVVRYYSQ